MKRITMLMIIMLGFSFAYCAQEEKEMKIDVKGKADSGVGLVIKSLDDKAKEKYDIDEGAFVMAVVGGSSAEEAGLKEHDIVIEANGTAIEDAKQLNDLAEALEMGDKLSLTVMRDGEKKSYTTEVKDMKSGAYVFKMEGDGDYDFKVMELDEVGEDVHVMRVPGVPHMDKMIWKTKGGSDKGGFLGVELDNVNDQMKDYFEVEYGALIEKVVKDSPAEKAGLKAGDVITKIGDKKIEDPSDVVRTVNFYDPEDVVTVYFSRKGDDESVKVTLGEKKHKSMGSTFWVSEDDEDGGAKVKREIRINAVPGHDVPHVENFKLNMMIYII